MFSKILVNLIGLCVDSIQGMAPLAKGQLVELLDPKRTVTELDASGVLFFDKAVETTRAGQDHKSASSIKKLIDLLEVHRQKQESSMGGSFKKMEEALMAKKQLNDEISDFEVKQRAMLNITMTVIMVVLVVFCFCCYRYKGKKAPPKEKLEEIKEEEWEVYGTEEEQRLKREKMAKLKDTLMRMDEEAVRLRKELEELKKK